MNPIRPISLLLLSFVLFSCSSSQINLVYDHSFDFSSLTSYKIIKKPRQMPDGSSMPSATFNLIKKAIDVEMAAKGIGKNNEWANFGITWHTALNNEVYETEASLTNWSFSFSDEEKGMLIIDVFDLATETLIWRGWEKNVLSSSDLEEGINEAVIKILETFPPTR